MRVLGVARGHALAKYVPLAPECRKNRPNQLWRVRHHMKAYHVGNTLSDIEHPYFENGTLYIHLFSNEQKILPSFTKTATTLQISANVQWYYMTRMLKSQAFQKYNSHDHLMTFEIDTYDVISRDGRGQSKYCHYFWSQLVESFHRTHLVD